MDKSKSEVTAFILITTFVILLLVLLMINLLLIGRNKRLRFKNDIFEMQNQLQAELQKTRVEVAESTLNDVARDLHDDVGQLITFSILQLNNLAKELSLTSNIKLKEVRESMQEALQSIRNISRVLSHDYISSFGINNSIKQLFEGLNRKNIIEGKLNFIKDVQFKSQANEIFAFRIIQECISNTIKHAEANFLILSIDEKEGNILIEYEDNGKGISLEMINSDFKKFSMGFSNLSKRAELMKGTINYYKSEIGGLKTVLTFPNI